MASNQRRIGPNQVGYLGILQPFSDGFKLILKETILPSDSNKFIFLFAPFLLFFLSLLNWLVIPLRSDLLPTELTNSTILILIAIGELEIFGVLFSGYSANSKYTFIGGLRSTSQMLSYSIN
jgi:NADH-ubiquinone oxidoreductase chain 1